VMSVVFRYSSSVMAGLAVWAGQTDAISQREAHRVKQTFRERMMKL
jgi:hypothetical protein